MTTKIEIPAGIRKVSWTPNYMRNGIVKSIGNDKLFGITVKNEEATPQQHFDFGVTHVADLVEMGQTFSQKWANYRSQGFANPTAFADQFSVGNGNLDKRKGYGGQLQEDGFTQEQALEGFGRLYDKLAAADPTVTSPADTWIFGDYFIPLPGGIFSKALSDSGLWQKHRDNLASEATCRLNFNFGDNNFAGTNVFYNSAWGYAKQNGLIPSNYLNSWVEIRLGIHPYQVIFDLIKSRGGCRNRRLVSFDWSSYDNASWGYHRTKTRVRFEDPAGVLHFTQQWQPIPFEIMKQRAFFHLLMGDGMVMWEVSFASYSNNPHRLHTSINAAGNQWQPDGGSLVSYNSNNPAHPSIQVPGSPEAPVFPDYALGVGENGVAAGVYLYASLKEEGLLGSYEEWIPFTYSVAGGATQNGYKGGVNPMNGNNGNARLSNRTTPNYSEHNVVDSCETSKPLVCRMVGPSGYSYWAINPHADPDQTTIVTLPTFGNQTMTLVGDSLEIFKP